jgi:hypothetical protein
VVESPIGCMRRSTPLAMAALAVAKKKTRRYKHLKVSKSDKFVPGNDQDTKTPQIRETAVNYYNVRTKPQKGKVTNFPPEIFLKNTNGDVIDFVEHVGDVVVNTAKAHRAGNEKLFDQFKEATRQTLEARIGDHGSHLIEAAEKFLGPRSITVETEPIGDHEHPPRDNNGKPLTGWTTLDWQKTTQGGNDKIGVDATAKAMQDFEDDFYRHKPDSDAAKRHWVMMNAFKSVARQCEGCF